MLESGFIHSIKVRCEDLLAENLNSNETFIHLYFNDRTGSQ